MWFQYSTFIVCFYIVSTSEAKSAKTLTAEEELTFADVLKNISRVNSVLEDLIKNYEQMKKLHRSIEISSLDEESDSEIDEVFKSHLQFGDSVTSEEKQTQTTPSDDGRPATGLYWSDKKEEDEILTSSSIESEISENETAEKEENYYTHTSLRESIKLEEVEPVEVNVFKDLTDLNNKDPPDEEPTTQKEVSKKDFRSNDNLEEINSRVTSKNSITTTDSDEEFLHTRKVVSRGKKNRFTFKRHGMINNGTDNLSNYMKDIPDLNSQRDETLNQTDNDNFSKEQIKNEILRSDYGDACLQLVVEKCRKACVAAQKSVCKIHNCKSDFKTSYRNIYKEGCRKEFRGVTDIVTDEAADDDKCKKDDAKCIKEKEKKKEKKIAKKRFLYTNRAEDAIDTNDMLRSGYLVASCLPLMDKQALRILEQSQNTTIQGEPSSFNILRDKYETECKKRTSSKCSRACKYAFKEACEDRKCKERFIKRYKKVCKTECNKVYKLSSVSRKSSGSSDSDSEDTDSDSD